MVDFTYFIYSYKESVDKWIKVFAGGGKKVYLKYLKITNQIINMLVNIKSALVSGVLMAILGIATYIIGLGSVFSADGKTIVNIGVLALLTSIVSFVKSSLTTDQGTFSGIKIK